MKDKRRTRNVFFILFLIVVAALCSNVGMAVTPLRPCKVCRDAGSIPVGCAKNEKEMVVEIEYTRRQITDHQRYMAHREERLERQREYYKAHREYYINYMRERRKHG